MLKSLKKFFSRNPAPVPAPPPFEEVHSQRFDLMPPAANDDKSPALNLVKGKDGVFALPSKPGIGSRILQGLPGFVTSAGMVMGAKAGVCALCASASPLAIAAASIGAGAIASQTVSHFRDRWSKAETERGEKISLKTLVKEFNTAALKREASVFGQALKSKEFWKGAGTKGAIAGALGTAFGFAASSDIAHEYADKARDYIGNLFAKPDVKVAAPSRVSSGLIIQEPSAASSIPAESANPVPKDAETLLDRAKAILVASGFNTDANEKILANSELTEAQRIKDISVKFRMGSEIKRALLDLAAGAGNEQAQYDLKVVNGEIVPKPQVAVVPAPTASVEPNADMPAVAAPAAPEVPRSPLEQFEHDYRNDIAPQPVGSEAGRCIVGLGEKGSRALNTLCSAFKDIMMPNDHVLMQSADGGLNMTYVHDGDSPKETDRFLDQSRQDFRDTVFLPLRKADIN